MKKGFTLLELLVTISIIGILVTVAAASFTTGQQRSRDAKRRADLLAIQKSLEQCFAVTNSYPAAGSLASGLPLTCGTKTTMNLVPFDPKNTGNYVYTYTVTDSEDSYCLCGLLEKSGSGNADSAGANGLCSFSPQDYQCLTSQQ